MDGKINSLIYHLCRTLVRLRQNGYFYGQLKLALDEKRDNLYAAMASADFAF